MRRTRFVVAGGFALVALATGVFASDDGGANVGLDGVLAAELRVSAEPRDWALAADVADADGAFPADRAELLARAAAAAPNDTLVQWLALSNLKAPGPAPSDPADRARRLAASDPGNAAAWLPSLSLAVDERDAARVDEVLGRMAAAERFDEHFRDYLLAWLDVYARRTDRVGEIEGYVDAMGRAAAYAMPGFKPAATACDPAKNDRYAATRRGVCERLARTMTAGNTILTQAVGYAMLRKIDRATPEDAERERALRWLARAAPPVDDESLALDDVRRMVADWRDAGSEEAVFHRRAQRAGVELTPPPDWHWSETRR